MKNLFNIYCDESCHLEKDQKSVMVLGCVWCPTDRVSTYARNIRAIKAKHGLVRAEDYTIQGRRPFEIKWSKVSPGKTAFYTDVVDWFFAEPELHFRGLVIPDKRVLNHEQFGQTHDQWYYKMMFLLIDRIINPEARYRVYLDIKDTRSEIQRQKLEEVLRNSNRDPGGTLIERVQQIRSHESELLQLADLLLGAIAYQNRRTGGDLKELSPNQGKVQVIQRIQNCSHRSLTASTWQGETKFNLLRWASGARGLAF